MEKLEEVFAQYEFTRKKMFRGRTMLMCEDEYGEQYGIAEAKASEYRLCKEFWVKSYLMEHHFEQVDQLIPNKEGRFLSEDRYHTPFLLKKYFTGRECDVNSVSEVYEGAENLAQFHQKSRGIGEWLYEKESMYWEEYKKQMEEEERETDPFFLERTPVPNVEQTVDGMEVLESQIKKRNQELRRIAGYMKKPGRKGAFVTTYNDYAPQFLKQASEVTENIHKQKRENMQCNLFYGLCHGNYQHHNILKLHRGWATVGMENYHFGIQLEDLYDFLRKILEKNDYRFSYAQAVLEGYEKVKPLEKEEYWYLYTMLCYPHKFWKISNHYFNTKKTWVPPKTVEKLNKIVEQDVKKQAFLERFERMYV